jgi:hypothetical protein
MVKRSRLSGLSKEAKSIIARLPRGIKWYTFMTDPEYSDFEVTIKAFSLDEAYKKLLAQEGLRKDAVVLDEVATYTGKITAEEKKLSRDVG